jgi:hypothetical protein
MTRFSSVCLVAAAALVVGLAVNAKAEDKEKGKPSQLDLLKKRPASGRARLRTAN